MFSKVLVACLVLYTVQVFGGSIKPKLPAEVENVVQQIDMKAILLENDIKKASVDRKHEMDLVKVNNKMALKQLKNAIKASKGGDAVCTQIANLESRAIEQRANEAKLCDDKLDLKELQRNLHGYLKNLHEEAMLVDKYCAFINPSEADRTQCVTDSVAALEAKLSDVQTVISIGMTNHQNQSESCFKSVLDDVQLGSASIQIKLRDCLNPSTEAPVENETAVQDGSSLSSSSETKDCQSSESSENKNSDESHSSNADTEDGDGENNGGESDDQKQTVHDQDGGESNNNGEDTTTEDDQEGDRNDKPNNVSDDQKQESGNDATQAPADTEKLADKQPTEKQSAENNNDALAEDNSAKDTPVEDTPVKNNNTNVAAEVPAEDNQNADEEKASLEENTSLQQPEDEDDDEINIEY